MEKKFASQADLEEKKVSFDRLSEHAYAYTAEGDPNTGIVIGDDAVMVIDAQATPVMAQDVIRHIRTVTDKPIRYVTLTHYHAVRVLGASGYQPQHVIASRDTLRPDRRARRSRHEERDRALPAAVPRGRVGARPDLADHRVREADDAVDGQAAGRDHAARPRPHEGRHRGLAAAGEDPVLGRPRRVRRDAVHRRRLPDRLAGDARRGRGARRGEARARPRRARCGPRPT